MTYDAVKFALIAHNERLRNIEPPQNTHSHIKQVRFEGGTLDNNTIHLSPELNTLIGIRGSGKSSIIEALRYTLNLPIEDSSSDFKYKKELIDRTLGSGGKVIVEAIDRHGQEYQICRVMGEQPDVYCNGKLQHGLTINETILYKPLLFGQRELAANSNGAENELIEKLLGNKCVEIRQKIEDQKIKVIDAIEQLARIANVGELIVEQENAINDAKHRLKLYKDHNLEEKLYKQINFDKDIRKVDDGVRLVKSFADAIKELLANYEDDLRNYTGHSSVNNAEFFKNFDSIFSVTKESLNVFRKELEKTETVLTLLEKEKVELVELRRSLVDEFAEIERILATELKSSMGEKISPADFMRAQKKLTTAESKLTVLRKNLKLNSKLENELNEELSLLRDLWHEEFKLIKAALEAVSVKNTALKFSVDYRGDKDSFFIYFKDVFVGSRFRQTVFEKIANEYPDFIEIYKNIDKAKQYAGDRQDSFLDIFTINLKNLLTYQTPNKYVIKYHDTELEHHSLGQRASALILFVLGQRDNDVIIIDQPEDDLDSKTIYEDVISLLRQLKGEVQFIFATHNPNITVLGDAEQIHGCSFEDDVIVIQSSPLDSAEQQKLIVNIMEGGKEAFDRRKEIYKGWKS